MKKTLVALAATAAVGAAFAQSTVTLYGRIDTSFGATEAKATNAAGVTTHTQDTGFTINSGETTGSRWGMRGTEDLGGGLKANFQLEGGFRSDNGTIGQSTAGSNPLIFGRVAVLSLSGDSWGALEFGRTYTPYDNMLSIGDPHGYGNWGGINAAYTKGIHSDVGRQDNAISYKSPTWSGFKGEAMFAAQENAAPTGSPGQSGYFGFNLLYNNGPIAVGFGYEDADYVAGSGLKTEAWAIGGGYDFGMFKLGGGFAEAKQSGAAGGLNGKDKGWHIGASMPIGVASLQISWGEEKTTGLGAGRDSKSNGGGIYGSYPLSKRTYTYIGLFGTETEVNNSSVGTDLKKYAIGLVHNF